MELLEKLAIDPINKKYLENYAIDCKIRNLKDLTIETKIWKLFNFLKWVEFKDLKIITEDEIKNFFYKRSKAYKSKTVHNDYMELKVFFRWLRPNDELINFKHKLVYEPPNEKRIPTSDFKKVIGVIPNIRDKALVMLFYDSGARLDEIYKLNVGDLEYDEFGMKVYVTGKTGGRDIRLFKCIPYIQDWIRFHPVKVNGIADPRAPLFVVERKRNGKFSRLSQRRIQGIFHHYGVEGDLDRNFHPHMTRHMLARELAKKMTEMEMRKHFGWVDGSKMPDHYSALTNADIDRKLLEVYGLLSPEEVNDQGVVVRKCPRCNTMNGFDDKFCKTCNMILDRDSATQLDNIENSTNMSMLDIMKKVISSPEVQAKLMEETQKYMKA